LLGHHSGVNCVAWSPGGNRLASGGGEGGKGELCVWDVLLKKCVRTFVGRPGVIYAVAWSPNGDQLISGSSDGTLCWWDVQSGEFVRAREAHQGTIQSLRISPDGCKLASCGDDGAIKIWDLHSEELLQTLRRDRPYERLNITGIQGLTEAQKSTLQALGAIEEKTTFL
jgi:WD40 repeat protein